MSSRTPVRTDKERRDKKKGGEEKQWVGLLMGKMVRSIDGC